MPDDHVPDERRVPAARSRDLVVSELPDEVLVYDLKSDRAHCLNPVAARVWEMCDGQATVSAVSQRLSAELGVPAEDVLVRSALHQLDVAGLLEEGARQPRVTRREVLRRLGMAAAALPLVSSLVAPTAASAASQCGTSGCLKLTNNSGVQCGSYINMVGTCWLTNGETTCSNTNTDQRTCLACAQLNSNHSWCL